MDGSNVTESVTLANADINQVIGERRHDPLCPASGLGDHWADLCGDCKLIARVREDERRRTIKAASEALDVLDRWGEDTYRHVVIDYDEAVTAIESLGDEDD